MKDAQKSLAWLRGFAKPHQVQNEFDELVRYTKMSYALGNSQGNPEEKAPLDNKSKADFYTHFFIASLPADFRTKHKVC